MTVNVIVCRVGRLPVMETLAADPNRDRSYLTSMQKIVGGLVDCVTLMDGLDIWCNDEAHLFGLPLNRAIPYPFGKCRIYGDFLIARSTKDGELASVTPEDFQRYLEVFDTEDIEAAKKMMDLRAALDAQSDGAW